MAKKRISDARLVALAAKKTRQEIALITGLHYDTVRKRLKKLGVEPKTDANKQVVTSESVRADIATLVAKQRATQNAKKLRVIAKELVRAEKELEALKGVGGFEIYKIKSSKSDHKKSEATSLSLFSDLHGEEKVKLSQTNGVNEYNTKIAKESTDEFFKVVAKLIKVHQEEYDIKNHICALLGDFISGSIHDDLKEGNDIQPTEATWLVGGWILSGIKYLRTECPEINLIIPCSMGNHSRITEKQRVSTEYGNSLELLIYNRIKEYFEDDNKVKVIITDSYFTYVEVYGKMLAFHHGHSVRYMGGVGGLTIPMNKAIAKWDTMKKADWYFSGHAHTFFVGSNFIVNGSVIGYNPYAIRIKAGFERPTQTFCIINKERDLEVIRKIILR